MTRPSQIASHVLVVVGLLAGFTASTGFGQSSATGSACENLKQLELPETTITSAQIVPAGGFTVPPRGGGMRGGALPANDRMQPSGRGGQAEGGRGPSGPGVGHCGGGPGPNTLDGLTALVHWVEQGNAPDQIIATRSTAGRVDRTRPLCPYPQVARYKGTGSTDDDASFVCTSETIGGVK